MGSMFPALDIKQPEGPLQQYLQVQQIRAGFLGQQVSMQELANAKLTGQKLQMEVQGQKNVIAAQHDADWDASDLGKVQKLFDKYGVPQDARNNFYKSAKDYNDLIRQTSADHQKITQDMHNWLDDKFEAARNAKPGTEQDVYDRVKQEALQYAQGLPQGYKETFLQEIQKAPAAYNPDWLDQEHALLRTSQDLNEAALKKAQTAEATQKANQAGAEVTKTLSGYDVLSYFAAKGDKNAQAMLDARQKREVQMAGQKAGAEAAARFPYELQLKQQEMAQNPVFAVNPKTGQRELTTIADAKASRFTNPVKVSQSDLEHETTLNAQLNDLQLNTSRYKSALNAMGPLTAADRYNMTRVLSDKSISSFLTNELTLGAAMDQISQSEKGSAWNALSPDKQAALIGSLRMKNSALLFQKVSTGMGRASKEAMDIEIANMPSPIEGATVGNQKLQAFQENIDQMGSRAVKLPWQESYQDVKARVEGQAVKDYNARQGAKQQGQYPPNPATATRQYVKVNGQMKKVTKVYPDGSFDAE